jgi:hypothetical protein
MWTNRASVTGSEAGAEVEVDPILGASASDTGLVFGLSSTFDKAGLGSSLGAGDGRMTGLQDGDRVSGFPSTVV